jgi:Integral membrane protein TerC family
MQELFVPEAIAALFQVVMIDLALAGDNAIVVGLAAAGLPQEQRSRAILFGLTGATVLLVLFAGITTQLLKLVGLLFAGGILSSGCAGKCGESFGLRPMKSRKASRRWPNMISTRTERSLDTLLARPWRKLPGRSSSPTSRCRSTMFSPSRELHESIPLFLFSALVCRLS